jgi:methionyl-tRNA formyltransferase
MKVVFMGGKLLGPRCLNELLNFPEFNIKLVVVNRDDLGRDSWYPSLAKLSHRLGLPVSRPTKVNDHKFEKVLFDIEPDYIFCVFYEQILKSGVLHAPTKGAINIHYAPLPKYRGRFSTMYGIFNGDKEAGVTIHWIDRGIDTGQIISQHKVPIYDTDTAKDLYYRCTETGINMFRGLLAKIVLEKRIRSRKQDESKATYTPHRLPNDGKIDWTWDSKRIHNFIRAMTFPPYPGPTFTIGDKEMIIQEK